MYSVEPWIPTANDACVSMCQVVCKVFGGIIFPKRNIKPAEQFAQTKRFCSEKAKEPGHPEPFHHRQQFAESARLTVTHQRVINSQNAAALATQDAARSAGSVVCLKYEIPADKETKAVTRGNKAAEMFAVMLGES